MRFEIANPVILSLTWITAKNLIAGLLRNQVSIQHKKRRSFSVNCRSLQDDGKGDWQVIK